MQSLIRKGLDRFQFVCQKPSSQKGNNQIFQQEAVDFSIIAFPHELTDPSFIDFSARSRQFSFINLQRKITPVQREIGIVIRIPFLQHGLPLFTEFLGLPVITLRLLALIVQAAGDRLEVI